MSAPEEKEGGDRGFAPLLGHIGDGELLHDLTKQLRTLVNECTTHAYDYQTKGKGSLTLSLSLVAEQDGTVRVTGDVKIKAPKPKARGALFWASKNGTLSAENPRQTKLPLRDVNERTVAVRDLNEKPEVKEAGK